MVYVTPTAPVASIGSDAPTSVSGTAAISPTRATTVAPVPGQPLTNPAVIGSTDLAPASATVDSTTYPHTLSDDAAICSLNGDSTTYKTDRKYTHFHALVGITDGSDNGAAAKVSLYAPDSDTPLRNFRLLGRLHGAGKMDWATR
jgi:hypothetical protein